jgi:hypothetical protein
VLLLEGETGRRADQLASEGILLLFRKGGGGCIMGKS